MIKKYNKFLFFPIIIFCFLLNYFSAQAGTQCASNSGTCYKPSLAPANYIEVSAGNPGCAAGRKCYKPKTSEATACKDNGGPTANCYSTCDGKEAVPTGDAGCKNESGKKCCKLLAEGGGGNSGILPPPTGGDKGEGDYSLNDFVQLAVNVSDKILGLVGSLALLAFVYGGIVFLISGGSSEKVEKGKQILLGAVIGLAVVFASYTIIQFTMSALGVQEAADGGWAKTSWFTGK